MEKLSAIEAEDLICQRGGRIVFRDVSFHLRAGELLTVEGLNGTGKTSLLRVLAGFLSPASGTIRFGKTVRGEERSRFIGWLGHQDALKPQMTVRETLRFFGQLFHGHTPEQELAATEEKVGLQRCSDLSCQYLSAGQKKRLALARLPLMRRPVWLLDEPLAALDSNAKALCGQLIESHCTSGGVTIAATHEPLTITSSRLVLTAA